MNLAKIHNELDRLFDVFNEKYYDNFLVKPMIIIQSTGKKPINVYCTLVKTWKKVDEEGHELYEIGISAEHLAREVYGLCGTLLHEMTHLFCLMSGIKDVSPNFIYHNKKFKIEAEKRGLIIEQAPKIGYSVTKLNEEAKVFVDSLTIDPELFTYARMLFVKPKVENKYKMHKFECPSCGEVVLSKNQDLQCTCTNCEEDYIPKE